MNYAVVGEDGFVRVSSVLEDLPFPEDHSFIVSDSTLLFETEEELDDWREKQNE